MTPSLNRPEKGKVCVPPNTAVPEARIAYNGGPCSRLPVGCDPYHHPNACHYEEEEYGKSEPREERGVGIVV